MSARPGPGGGYRATGIPTAISLGGFGAESHVFDKFGEAQRYHFTGEEKERVSPKEATRPIVAGQQIPSWFSRLPYCYRGLLRTERHAGHQGCGERDPHQT